ncbi:MAG: ribosome maturation factor RimP [Ignavibacteriales bacterium CG07_land_8_20_14_0_80_59_12]|nr:MAG: ribosome maturation factor RimP [Ignavibacteriales bacterium CG07_land_8_20_14_0_80_59_12]
MERPDVLKIRELVEPAVEEAGAFLVDLVLRGEPRSAVLEMCVDTEAGITVDRCADISRRIAPLLQSGLMSVGPGRIQVSSPGLDRPLKFARQYPRNIGRLVHVRYREGSVVTEAAGRLTAYDALHIAVQTSKGLVEIPFDSIVETKVQPSLKG